MSRLVVHIDRLVLRGFRAQDRQRIAAGLQQELGRLLADPAALPRWNAIAEAPGIEAGRVRLAHRSPPARAGELVAQRIGREMLK